MEITIGGAAAVAAEAAAVSCGLLSTEPCILCGGQQEPTDHMTPPFFWKTQTLERLV